MEDDDWSEGKPTVPLIPKPGLKYNHDSSHILRKVFQDILEEPTLSENVVHNWANYNIDSFEDKAAALDILAVKEKSRLQREDINIVEQKLNVNLVHHKSEQEARQKDPRGNKKITFPKIDQNDAKEYGLITGKDLLPSRIDQSLEITSGFGIYKEECALCVCPSLENLNITSEPKLPKITTRTYQKVNPSEMKQWKEICCKEAIQSFGQSRQLILVDSSDFKLNKETVLFADYQTKVVYKKHFKLQNISNKRLPVILDSCQNQELARCFKVRPDFGSELILSPGLSAGFTVYFRSSDFLDVQDIYEVCGHKVKLVSYREAPHLALFVLRNSWPMRPMAHSKFDVARAQALNDTIEIGSCFVGESFESYLIFKNNGGYGKFFFMTELQWITQNIDSMKDDLNLDFGSFSIDPNYFELASGEYIVIRVQFYGEVSNTCIENLLLVCNNINWVSIDFIADVIIFDKYTVSCDGVQMTEFITSVLKQSSTQIKQHAFKEESFYDMKSYSATKFRSSNPNPHLTMRLSVTSAVSNFSDKTIDVVDNDTIISTESSSLQLLSIDFCSDDILEYLLEQEKIGGLSGSEEDLSPMAGAIIDFGNTLGFNTLRRTVAIYNNCMIHLKYRWEYRETNTSWYPIAIREMNTQWLQFEEGNKVIPAYGKVEFGLSFKPNTVIDSYYSIGLGLIIEDIPRCAVRLDPKNHNFCILEKEGLEGDNDITPVVDVQVALFDAICFVDNVKFFFEPKNIFGAIAYQHGAKIRTKFSMITNSCSEEQMSGIWVSNANQRVIIQPEEFFCTSGSVIYFEAEVTVTSHIVQNEVVTVVLDDNFTQSVNLKIYVQRPRLHFSRSFLNMGTLLVGNSYERQFKILNANDANVDWEIREQYNKDVDRGGQNVISIQANNLSCGNVEITYRVTTGAPVKWNSLLLLFVNFEDRKYLDSRIAISYDIVDIPVCVHSSYSDCPILSPDSPIFVSSSSTFKLCFHNLTNSHMSYEISNIYGDHAEFCDITVSPKKFVLGRYQAKRIDVTITPSKSGVFDDIYLAFDYVDNSLSRIGETNPPPPLVVTVLISVEDISVRVILPRDKNDHHTEIIWPPSLGLVSEDGDQSWQSGEESPVTGGRTSLLRSLDDPHPLPIDIFQYFKDLENADEDFTSLRNDSVPLSDFCSDSTTTTVKTETTCWKFDEDSTSRNVSHCIIEITGVALKQLMQCSIKLENVTPVPGVLQIDTVNFPPKEYHKKRFDKVLESLNYIKASDEWDKKIGPHGLMIEYCCLDGSQELKPFGTNEIIFSIYGNTWGTYKEQVSIDFNNILPLRINLLVEIVGIPLEFPIGVNNIHKTTILRFGTLAYKSHFEIHNLQIKNTSAIPININWHIFMRQTHEELAKEPITILFDIYHPDEEDLYEDEPTSQGNLMIAHGKIVGKSETKIFKMTPKESLIQPQETKVLQIGLNPSAYASSFSSKEIEAYLIGYPHLPERYRNSPLFKRPVGNAIQPIKAKITAVLELPILQLDMSIEDRHIVLFADKVIKEKNVKIIRNLIFKNLNHVEANVKFRIGSPFVMERAQIADSAMNCFEGWYYGIVPPAQAATLKLTVKMDANEVFNIAPSVYESEGAVDYFIPLHFNASNVAKFEIVKHLHIEQKGFRKQEIPMSVNVYFPMLDVPTKLDFAEVLIGCVSKKIITLKNYSACTVEFNIIQASNFRTYPEQGVIPPGKYNVATIFDLSVTFIPQSHQKYNEKVTIQTQIPCLIFRIDLEAFGRYNEAFYKPDTC